jgi:2-methylisocitrate lyase-like PEP mutase family enzyme
MRMTLRSVTGLAALGALLLAGPAYQANAATADGGNIPTVASMAEAKTLAAKNQVPILVDFSTDW